MRIPSWAKVVAALSALVALALIALAIVSRSRAARSLALASRRWHAERERVATEIDIAIARERADVAQDASDQAVERWRLALEHQDHIDHMSAEDVVRRWGRR